MKTLLFVLIAVCISFPAFGQTNADSLSETPISPPKRDNVSLGPRDKANMAIGVKVLNTKYGGFLDSALWTVQLKKEEKTIGSMLSGRYTLLIEMGLAYPILSACLADITLEGRQSPGIAAMKDIPGVIETRCEDKAIRAEANYQLLQILCNHFHDSLVADIAALTAAGAMNNNPSYIKKTIQFLIDNRKIKTLGKATYYLADAGKDDVTTFICDNNWDDDAFIVKLLPEIVVNENTVKLFENAIREERFRKDRAYYKALVEHLARYYKATKQSARYDSLVKYYKSNKVTE